MDFTHDSDATAARLRAVDDHVRFECAHELDALMGTFGQDPEWHQIGEQRLHGPDAISGFYADLFRGFPDFWLDVRIRHLAQDSIVLEGILGGTHKATWKGIEPTGKTVEVPFCAIFTFTDDGRVKSETVYTDRLALLSQLGVINVGG